MEFLPRILRAARARLAWQLLFSYLSVLLVAASVALLLVGILHFFAGLPPFQLRWVVCAYASALVASGLLVWLRAPNLKTTTRILDRRGRTKDRFLTAFTFQNEPTTTPMEAAALRECSAFLEKTDWKALTPITFPRRGWVFLTPLVALALLQWQFVLLHRPNAIDPGLDALVKNQADNLKSLATQIEETKLTKQSEELERLVKELRESSKRLIQERQSDEQIRKAALREFSSLEAMLKEMMRSMNPETSPEELAALAEALKRMDQDETAKDLEQGKFDDAARKLEELMKQLQKGADPEKTRQQLADSMKEAVDRLSEEQKNEVAEQMRQMAEAAAAMNDPELQEAMQKLQKLMQELARSGAGKKQQQKQQGEKQEGEGQQGQQQMPMTAEAIKQLIEALEKMKQQMQEGGEPGGEGDTQITLQMPGQDGPPGGEMLGMGDGPPSGQPGSELDTGTTETPFGAQGEKPKAEGGAKRLPGLLGEGESLRELVGAAGDSSQAKRRYREIYQATQAEAQSTVTQESIPLGSRLLIRRYFESIRPKE